MVSAAVLGEDTSSVDLVAVCDPDSDRPVVSPVGALLGDDLLVHWVTWIPLMGLCVNPADGKFAT